MEKAKDLIQEMQTTYENSSITNDVDSLKSDINNTLVTYLPGDLTVNQFEAIAVTIVHIITNPKEYLK